MRVKPWIRTSGWVLARFTRPTGLGRASGLAVLSAMLLSIGFIDYASGIRISLAVFYLIPILLAVAWFGWRVATGMAVASAVLRIAGDFLSTDEPSLPFWSWWNSCSAMLVSLFVVWIFSNLLALFRQLEGRFAERTAELLHATERRRRLEHELLTVSAHERNRIGQELHDDVCQHLVATSLAAQVLAQRLARSDGAPVAQAQAIVGLIEEGTTKTRRLAQGLLLSEIDPQLLAEKLGALADEGSRSGVPCHFTGAGDMRAPDADTAAQLYRIAQEAMRNALRHADASRVDLSLVGDRHALCLVVEDDGHGTDLEPGSGMGLPIMMHRAAYIGATLSIVPTAGQGTRVICHLPCAARP